MDSSSKKELVESKPETLSITRVCVLLDINRTSLYYTPLLHTQEQEIKEHIQKIFEEIPSYGYLKVHQQLLEEGVGVSPNTVLKYRQQMGLKAVLAVRA